MAGCKTRTRITTAVRAPATLVIRTRWLEAQGALGELIKSTIFFQSLDKEAARLPGCPGGLVAWKPDRVQIVPKLPDRVLSAPIVSKR